MERFSRWLDACYRRVVLVSFGLALAACASQAPVVDKGAPRVASARMDVRFSGLSVVRDINAFYVKTVATCARPDGQELPAFYCSGLLMRATGQSEGYMPWLPKPGATAVSFSWLRLDASYRGTWEPNGFIFWPPEFAAGIGVELPQVECAFADDAYTWIRTQAGCGPTSSYPAQSGPCQGQGIVTAEAYRSAYQPSGWFNERICGFSVGPGIPGAAVAFNQVIRVMAMMGQVSFDRWNELMVRAWQPGRSVPVAAFYYVVNPRQCRSGSCGTSADPKSHAMDDQRSFASATGQWVPVIAVRLPDAPGDRAAFAYSEGDQGVLP